MYTISRKYNVPLALIMRANPYADVYNLQIGDEICVPVTNMGGIDNICTGNDCAPLLPEMPTQPSRPSVPMQPSTPSMPTQPSRPSMPTQPSRPSMPMQPSRPSMPTQPSRPSMPTQPSTPSVPMQPSTPSMPVTPTEPGVNLITYIIKDAETLKDILDKFDIDLEDFIENNNMSTVLLKPGMTINIPDRRVGEEVEE